MSKFTPGPWQAECVGSGGDYSNPTDVYEITNGHTRIAEYVSERDARLIAAAPRMAAFIERMASDGYTEACAILEEINGGQA